MEIKESHVRYIVIGMIIVIILGFWYAHIAGKKQDEQYLKSYNQFNQAVQLIAKSQFLEAKPLLKEIERKHPNSALVKYYLGVTLANTGELKPAIAKMKIALDLNPYLVENPIFMLQFAEILTFAGEKKEARLVLERCKTLPPPASVPDYQQKVDALIQETL
jgi:predicted Zn-dependent protease